MNSGGEYKVNISKFGFLIEKNVIKSGEGLVSDVLGGQIVLPSANEMEIPIRDVTSRVRKICHWYFNCSIYIETVDYIHEDVIRCICASVFDQYSLR